jgi:Predicted membrane protein (DUF2079)
VRLRAERARVAIVASVFGGAYALIGLIPHWKFASGPFDLVIFTQAIWYFSRFEIGPDTIRNVANPLLEHFSPALVVFAPVFWISASSEALIIAQGVVLAASIWPVHAFLRDRLPARTALIFTVVYGSFWPLQLTAERDVHELALAPLVIAVAVLALSRRRWVWLWAACLAMSLIKEDLIPMIAAFGIMAMVQGDRRHGAGLVVYAVTAMAAVLWILLPSLGAPQGGVFLPDYQWVLQEPWRGPLALFDDHAKVRSWLAWFGPLALLPAFSPVALLGLPVAASRLLSDSGILWAPGDYYSAPLAPVLVMAAGDGLRRLRDRVPDSWGREPVLSAVGFGVLVLTLLAPRGLPLGQLVLPETYSLPSWRQTGLQAVSMVGPDDSVAALHEVLAQVSPRPGLYPIGRHFPPKQEVDVVVLSEPLAEDRPGEVAGLRVQYATWGFAPVFEAEGWVVLRRPQ